MRVLDLFSGIGGFSLGLERAGMRTVAFCEIEPFPRRVLAKHWPEVPIYDDVRTLTAERLASDGVEVDLICGGFPCQDVSRAGRRAGLAGKRSGLYRELVRAIRVVRPKHAIVENVAALVEDGLDVVLGDLAASGYNAEWDCVPAGSIGAPHQRDRVWIIAHSQGGNDGNGDAGSAVGQEPQSGNRAGSCITPDAEGIGCGSGRAGRSPDSFAWLRDATRWNTGHAYREGLAERESVNGDARQEQQAAERAAIGNVWQSRWPCEPALLGMDDGVPDRVERVRALGNTLIPQIPELIGRAIIEAEARRN